MLITHYNKSSLGGFVSGYEPIKHHSKYPFDNNKNNVLRGGRVVFYVYRATVQYNIPYKI